MSKSPSVSEVKQKFEQVLSLRQDIINVFHILDSKIKVLQEVYSNMVATHSHKEYVFGIDSFCFQNELIETDYINLKDIFRRIGGRSYCEYYNLYIMVQQYGTDEITDSKVKRSVNFTHNFPPYKHLDTGREYNIDVVRDMQIAITGCITELESHHQGRETSLQADKEQSNLGLNIDNLVYTEMFRNTMLKAKIDMFYRYLEVFYNHHSKYYTRLLLKAKLHLGIVNEDILIKQFSQQSIDRSEIAHLKSPGGKISPGGVIKKEEDAQIKSYVQYDDMAESRQNVLSHIIASTGSDNSNGELNDDDSINSDSHSIIDELDNQLDLDVKSEIDVKVVDNILEESELNSIAASTECIFNSESVGKRVLIDGYDTIGTISFVGPHHKDNNNRVGITLDTKIGRNNGTVKGHKYFECEPGFGILVVPYKVHPVEDMNDP
jgi:hypothetical protein